jgi:16S rRNA (cytosine967-C5)-methyltransferase
VPQLLHGENPSCLSRQHTGYFCEGTLLTISTARTIAFDVLLRVAAHGAYADEALRAALSRSIAPEEAGLATELTFGVLRWQRLLDFLTDRHRARPGKALDEEVRIALRLGAYQLFFLKRIPARAAVHQSVELVKRARKRSAAPLVNAILRQTATDAEKAASPGDLAQTILPAETGKADRMGILYSHPTWLVERWIAAFGEARTETLLAANNRVPLLAGYVRAPEHRDEVLAELRSVGCAVQPGKLLRDALVFDGGNPSSSEAAARGWLAIQDEASQAVAHILGVRPGDRVLDLCAAPGGKTLRLASDAGPTGHVVAGDFHEHRVRAMVERLQRAGVTNVETVVLDAAKPLPSEKQFDKKFARILVDAPCSGTGTLARHPEIRWRLQPKDLPDLHARQAQILNHALEKLAPGGQLVYSTCSLEPEENEDVVKEALAKAPGNIEVIGPGAEIAPWLAEGVRAEDLADANGFFRTFPGEQETDGFFAGLLKHRP